MSWPKFLTQGRWIAGHIVILAMSALMIYLATWQWGRLQDRKADNRAIEAQLHAAPVTIDSTRLPADAVQYRMATLSGSFDDTHTVYERYPLLDGASGYYVLTPFLLDDGGAIVVNRGWIPVDKGKDASLPSGIPASGAPASGTVDGAPTVLTARIMDPEVAREADGKTNGNPPVPTVTQIDMARLQPLMGSSTLAPKYVQLIEGAPAEQTAGATPLPPPEISNGPHFSYTLQWTGFTIVICVGYVMLLIRSKKDQEEELAAAATSSSPEG